jgi:YidC/Oxa1 family membrane protein insertase
MQHNPMPDPKEHRRFFIAFALSLLVLASYYMFYKRPQDLAHQAQAQTAAMTAQDNATIDVPVPPKPVDENAALNALASRDAIVVRTERLAGSIALQGLRFDDVSLLRFRDHIDTPQPVRLLAPSGTRNAYFADIGVMPADKATAIPDQTTAWRVVGDDKTLTETHPVTVTWNNGKGLEFRRTIAVDNKYLFTVTQTIINKTQQPVTLYPYALISQSHHVAKRGEHVAFEDKPSAVMHTGAVAYLDGELEDPTYADLKDDTLFEYKGVKGWLGLTSKYWLVSLLPDSNETFDARFAHQQGNDADHDIFQADIRGQAVTIAAGQEAVVSQRLFAGAKQLDLLNGYEQELHIPHLDLAIDFGWLYFLTKPLYQILHWLGAYFAQHGITMSFALALLCMTILVRMVTFPLASKSFRSMAKMKQVGPQINVLKETHKNDKVKFQQEVIALYKREKVNPASGCVPLLIQIPIFFALYKTLFISLDMRHQPFWGWIQDMSAPDPSSVFNLFGLLPWHPPAFLMIGAWPILYGFTLWLQQKMQPTPDDPMQKQMMAIFPWMFMFLFAQFPAGLVIYYVWSNLLGIVQQYWIRRSVENEGLVAMPVPNQKKAKARAKRMGKDMPTVVIDEQGNVQS